jgi:hypothetical protein
MTGFLLERRAAIAGRLFVAALIIGLALLIAAEVVDVVPGIVAVGLVIAGAIVATNLQRIKRVVVGKDLFSLETHVADAQAAAAGAPPEEQEATARRIASPGGKLTELRLRLEAKLSYVAGHMDVESGAVTIGSLRHDGYLTDAEAATADLLLHTSEAEFARASPEDRAEFLEAAESLVDSIRASVLAGAVQKELKRRGWQVESADGGKRDLLARRDGRTARVVPVFAVSTTAELPAKVARRVARVDAVDRRVIVLPNNSGAPTEPGGDPAIVTLEDLDAALSA